MAVTADQVADYLISLASSGAEEDFLSPMRLQKLLYYVQGWWLGFSERPMFEEDFEAWAHGPVIPSIYRRFKALGAGSITPDRIITDPNLLAEESKDFINGVWEEYKQFSAIKLREMTHSESPWKSARKGVANGKPSDATMSKNDMKDFFAKQIEDAAQQNGKAA